MILNCNSSYDTVQPVPSSGNTISYSTIERSSKLEVLNITPDKAIFLSDVDKDEDTKFNAVDYIINIDLDTSTNEEEVIDRDSSKDSYDSKSVKMVEMLADPKLDEE